MELLGQHQQWLASTQPRRDVVLFLPYRRWIETDTCNASALAAKLSQANVQYEVVCEDDFRLPRLQAAKALLVESLSVLNSEEKTTAEALRRAGGVVIAADADEWLSRIKSQTGAPSVVVRGPATVRAVVCDQPRRTLVHLLNLNIYRRSSFEDEVHPAENLRLTVRVPFHSGCLVPAVSADAKSTSGKLAAAFCEDAEGGVVEFVVPRLDVAAILVLNPSEAAESATP
jgi:hypothetical protein